MSVRIRRNLLLPALFLGVAVFMVQCTPATAPSREANGLVCRSSGGASETDCRFTCPDGRELSLPQAVSSQSKDELNFLFCGVPLPDPAGGAQGLGSPFVATPTFAPPLSRYVESCDLNKHVIKFAFAQPAQELAGKTIGVEIQGQPVQCSVDRYYPGIYACNLAPHTSFPAGIVFRVNGQVVDLFAYTGGACLYGQGTKVPLFPVLALTANATQPAANPTHEPKPTHEPNPTHEPKPTHKPKPTKPA